MIASPTRVRLFRSRSACVALLLAFILAACGAEEQDREFAPEISDDQVLETPTPQWTTTPQPLDRQPGESGAETPDIASLIEQVGPARAVGFGLRELAVLTVEDGDTASTGLPRQSGSIAGVAPDGSLVLTIDRSGGAVQVVATDASGSEVATWRPQIDATPGATPVDAPSIQSGDLIVWNHQSDRAIVAIEQVGVYIADRELNLTPIAPARSFTLTAAAWAPTGSSIALGSWDADRQAARILTAALQDPGRIVPVLELADGDGRFVRSMAWGNERVGLVFALRSLNAGFSFPSDLYHLPRFGQSMRLLATAGAAAPAAVIDQIAIAGDGSTVAYTVLIPGEIGFRYHSLWIADATSPDPVRIETSGVRRVSNLVWTSRGLAVVGARRESTDEALFQASVVELVTADGLTAIGEVRSEATPIASPRASPEDSPVAATPAS